MKIPSASMTVLLWGIVLLGNVTHSHAGSPTSDTQGAATDWYAADEWTAGLWGTYAFTANGYPTFFYDEAVDQYLASDHGWGGGIELKRFFGRYLGVGLQGYALSATRSGTDLEGSFGVFVGGGIIRPYKETRTIGAALASVTLRYPLARSRLAPFVYVGGGPMFGGGDRDNVIVLDDSSSGDNIFLTTRQTDSTMKWSVHGGAGLEFRLTRRIGVTSDFSWHMIEGRHNNFGMTRAGIHVAF